MMSFSIERALLLSTVFHPTGRCVAAKFRHIYPDLSELQGFICYIFDSSQAVRNKQVVFV